MPEGIPNSSEAIAPKPQENPLHRAARAVKGLQHMWHGNDRMRPIAEHPVVQKAFLDVSSALEDVGNVVDVLNPNNSLRQVGLASRKMFIRQNEHFWLPKEELGKEQLISPRTVIGGHVTVEGLSKDLEAKREEDLKIAREMGVKTSVVREGSTEVADESGLDGLDPEAKRQVENLTIALARQTATIARERHGGHGPDIMAARGREITENLRPKIHVTVLTGGGVRMTAVMFDGSEAEVRMNDTTGEIEFFSGDVPSRSANPRIGRAYVTTYVESNGELRHVKNQFDETRENELVDKSNKTGVRSTGVVDARITRTMQSQLDKPTILTGVFVPDKLTSDTAGIYVEHETYTIPSDIMINPKSANQFIAETEAHMKNAHDYRKLNGVVVIDRNQAGEDRPTSLETLDLNDVVIANFGEHERGIQEGDESELARAGARYEIAAEMASNGVKLPKTESDPALLLFYANAGLASSAEVDGIEAMRQMNDIVRETRDEVKRQAENNQEDASKIDLAEAILRERYHTEIERGGKGFEQTLEQVADAMYPKERPSTQSLGRMSRRDDETISEYRQRVTGRAMRATRLEQSLLSPLVESIVGKDIRPEDQKAVIDDTRNKLLDFARDHGRDLTTARTELERLQRAEPNAMLKEAMHQAFVDVFGPEVAQSQKSAVDTVMDTLRQAKEYKDLLSGVS